MNRHQTTASAILAAACLLAATPAFAAFPLQLEVEGSLGRNGQGQGVGLEKLANMRLTVLDAGGAMLHQEQHCGVTTIGRYGDFKLCLGGTSPVDIPFDGSMNVRVEACFDKDGCGGVVDVDSCDARDFVDVLVSLCPVGFAHQARNADTLDGLDSATLLQELSFAHPVLSISDGNSVGLGSLANSAIAYDNPSRTLSVTDGSGTLSTSLAALSQTVSRSGLDVTLSNGGGTFNVADNDNDSANELQTLSRSGLDVTLSNGGGTINVADNDNDSANEMQTLSVSGNQLTISGRNTVTVPGDNLGNHSATSNLQFNGNSVLNALTGEFGDLGRFGNHGLSGRIAAGNATINVAIFGSNEGTTGFEVGVLGRTQSPGGYGVFSEGNFHSTGEATIADRLTIGNVPSAFDSQVLTVDGSGNVRKRAFPDLGNGYTYGEVRDNVAFIGYKTWDLSCPGTRKVAGGGAIDGGDPDLDCWIHSTGPNDVDDRHLTRVMCGLCNYELECDGESYLWSITCMNP